MGQPRKCLVSFRDREGVEHSASVTAESLYEAGAVALQQFRRADWSREESLDAGTLRVEVRDSTFYSVRVSDLEAWLRRSGGAPRDIAMKQKVRARLQANHADPHSRAPKQG
jgi:predicted Rdx family selenoprotein